MIRRRRSDSPKGNLISYKLDPGVFVVEVPEVGRKISLGQPPDAVKRFQQVGYVGTNCVTTFVLVDTKLQGDSICWVLVEFPILYSLYHNPVEVDGKKIPAFFAGERPILVGLQNDVKNAMVMIKYGNYGIDRLEDFDEMDIPVETRDALKKEILGLKDGNAIKSSESYIESAYLDPNPKNEQEFTDIGNGIQIGRVGFNKYRILYRSDQIDVDVNLLPNERFRAPVEYKHFRFPVTNFGIWHTGEYDGMDPYHSCAHTSIIHKYNPILIDYPSNMTDIIRHNGLSKHSVNTIILTHNHDDHVGGVVELFRRSERCHIVTTEPVRYSLVKKLSALVDLPEDAVLENFEWTILPFRSDKPFQTETLNLEGVNVTGHLSCHSVPTTIYTFSINVEGYVYTYGHFMDIVAFKRMKRLVRDGWMPKAHLDHLNDVIRNTKYSLLKYDSGCVSDEELGYTVHAQWQDLIGAATEPTFRVFSHAAMPLLDPAFEREGRFVNTGDVDSNVFDADRKLISLGSRDSATIAVHNQAYSLILKYFESLVDVSPRSDRDNLMRHYAGAFANCPIHYDPNVGGFLIEQGMESKDVIIIIRGRAEIRKYNQQGEIIFRSEVGDGEVLGDVGVMAGTTRMASVRSLNRMSYIAVPRNLFLEAMSALGVVYEGYFKQLFERVMLFESVIDISRDVSKIVINQIAKVSKTLPVKKDATLIQEGSRDNRLMVAPGDVLLTAGDRSERISGPTLIGECEFFLGNANEPASRLHTATALESMEVLILEKDLFQDVPVIRDNIRNLIRARCQTIYHDLPQINPVMR